MTILILGGTAEARQLAAALVADGVAVISSLAGRVSTPSLPAGRVRVGGFGGPDGLADYVRREHAVRRGGCDPPLRSDDHQERSAGGEPYRCAVDPAGASRLAGTPALPFVDLGDRRRCGTCRCRVSPPAIPHDGTAVAARLSSLGRSPRASPAGRSAQCLTAANAGTSSFPEDRTATPPSARS